MTSIIKSENGSLFLYRSEKEFPKREDYQNIHVYYSDRANWFSTAERIKVAEGERVKFYKSIFNAWGKLDKDRLDAELQSGVEINESCYEVRVTGDKDNLDGYNVAYFKDDRATEKETEYWVGSVTFKDGTTMYTKPFYEYDNGFKVWSAKFSKNNEGTFESIGCDKFEGQSERSHENTEPSPPDTSELKRHAIEFAEWLAKNRLFVVNVIPYSSEQLYNQFINRK